MIARTPKRHTAESRLNRSRSHSTVEHTDRARSTDKSAPVAGTEPDMAQGKDMDKAAGKEPDMDTELDTAQSLTRKMESRSGREKRHAR